MKQYGDPNAIGQVVGIRFSKTGGWRRMLRWSGPDVQIFPLIGSLRLTALDIDYIAGIGGADSVITATVGTLDDGTPTDNQLESVWELDEQEAYASLWEHPKIQAIFASRTVDDLAVARTAIERYVSTGTTEEPYSSMITSLRASSANFDEFLKRLARTNNQATWYWPTVIIRHTLTGPLSWRYAFNWDDVACQVSTATLVASETTMDFTPPPNRTWTFKVPKLRSVPPGKFQVVREWMESEQDSWLYTQL